MRAKHPPLVAHVIYALGTGGLENGLVNLVNRTPPDRYRHAIVCLTSAHQFARRITVPGVDIVELHKSEGIDPGMYWRLYRALRRLRPAIIHSRNLAALDVQAVGLLLPGVRQVHGEHGRDIYDLDGSNRKYRLLRRCMRPVIDHYIAVSRDLEHWLLDGIGVNPRRLSQIYNGVDQTTFQPGDDVPVETVPPGFLTPEAVVVGTVGRLVEVKDQATILRAAAALVRAVPALRSRLRVVMVGDGPLMEPLRRLTDELELTGLVWMAGDRADVPRLLRAMDIFLLPSLAEGISNTILEAMATGLPVVATRTGGNPELVADGVNGYLVPVGNADALAARIRELIEAPERCAAMGRAALEGIRERFDWGRTVSAYLEVYDRLLGIRTAEARVGARAGNLEAR